MNQIRVLFWNRDESRLRSLWRLAAFLTLFYVINSILSLILTQIGIYFYNENGFQSILHCLGEATYLTVCVLITLLLSMRLFDHRKFSSLYISFRKIALIEFAVGFLFCMILMIGAFVIEVLNGWIVILYLFHTTIPNASFLFEVCILFLNYFMMATVEELIIRDYFVKNLLDLFNKINIGLRVTMVAVITSTLFSIAHVGNFGVTTYQLIILFLQGLLFVISLLFTGRIMFAIGYHLAMNFVGSTILGFNWGLNEKPSLFFIQSEEIDIYTSPPLISWSDVIWFLVPVLSILFLMLWNRFKKGNWFNIVI